MLFLRLGGAGGMISAWRRSGPFRVAGVVAAGDRDRFFKRCVRRTAPAFRASYALFLEGKLSAAELGATGIRSVSSRKGAWAFGVAGVGVIAALLVFLTFYFLVPIGETVLRTAICAFHAALAAVSFRFLSSAYVARAEKAAARFSAALDGLILRPKATNSTSLAEGAPKGGIFPSSPFPERADSLRPSTGVTSKAKPVCDPDLADLRSILRELDRAQSSPR